MSDTIIKRMAQKCGTAAQWAAANTILLKGEIGIEIPSGKHKVGDGVTPWNTLQYATVTPADISSFGGGDMTKAQFATNADAASGYVDKAKTADRLSASLTAADIPALTLSKISDAGSAASKDVGTGAGNVPLIGPDGKLVGSIIPTVAIGDTFMVSSESAMLALSTAEKGDVAIRTDVSKTFILASEPYSTLANWWEMLAPGDVLSVNSQTGIVTLTTDNISEGATNKYYTDARFDTRFAAKSSAGLTDGGTILHTTDDFVISGGSPSDI